MNFEVIEIFQAYLPLPLSRPGRDFSFSGHCTCKRRHLPFNPSFGKPSLVCLMRALVTSDYSCVSPTAVFSSAGTKEVNLLLR